MVKGLRAVFFDAAGTLFETRAPVAQSYARMAREFGVDASAAAVGAGFRRAFHEAPGLAFGPGHRAADLRRLEREWWRAVVKETFNGLGSFTNFDAYFEKLFGHFADPRNWRADPEAAPLLERLRRDGLAIGLISNFDYRVYQILEGLGLGDFFDSITISSEAGWAKPAHELFAAALARHLVRPSEALHVGDSPRLDAAGAQAAGLATVLIDRDRTGPTEVLGRTARVARLGAVIEVAGQIPFG